MDLSTHELLNRIIVDCLNAIAEIDSLGRRKPKEALKRRAALKKLLNEARGAREEDVERIREAYESLIARERRECRELWALLDELCARDQA